MPPSPDLTLLNEAAACHRAGRLEEAERLYRRVLEAAPDHAAALHRLGMIAFQRGRAGEAAELIRRALALLTGTDAGTAEPAQVSEAAEAWNNLAGVLGSLGKPAEAASAAREAVRLRPDFAQAHNNLGVALEQSGRPAEALAAFDRAVSIRPAYVEALAHRGNVLRQLGRPGAAEGAYRAALRLRPAYAAAHQNLAAALCETGRADEAVVHYRQVAALRPSDPAAGSSLLYALHYRPGLDPRRLFAEHLRWAATHAPLSLAAPAARAGHPHHDRDPGRPLRVGYVSPDLRQHAIAMFFEPLLENHDRRQFVTYCYCAARQSDATTARLRAAAGQWRDIASLSDEAAADLVRADGIDILVDLAGHGAGNRLPLFARRPAPLQVTYLGYPDTTGMRAIDYRLTDAVADPFGFADRLHAERLVRLGGCAWCYRPPDDAPPVAPPPFASAGCVRFGSFNNPAKLTPQVLRLWARVLEAVPGSRLVLKWRGMAEDGGEGARRRLAERGLPLDRLDLLDATPSLADHLRAYAAVDLALDPFPYNGTTTTCDALWMGVPVVCLAGRTHTSRVGMSLLTAAGLGEFIAADPDAYVRVAADWAARPERLADLRSTLRERVRCCALRDGPGLARRVEAEYRWTWRRWCEATANSQ